MEEEINNQEELNQARSHSQEEPKKRWNKTPFLIAGLVILTALLVILAVPIRQGLNPTKQSSAPRQAMASLSISNPVASTSGLYSADVKIDPKSYTTSGADLVIKYDPRVITNVKISNGSLFKNPTVLTSLNDPVKGIATYSAVSGLANPGVKGKGVFAVITFNLSGTPSGYTALNFGPGTSVAAEGQNRSILGDSFGVTFTPGK